MNTEKLAWYVSRSSGIMAWVLATASIVFGLALSTRLVRKKGVPAWLNSLHRYLGTLTLLFTAVHLGGLVADNWVHFGLADLVVPMASSWRPGAVAWGIVAMYLLVAVQVTSWCKRWLPRRLWHSVHLSSIPMFVFGTVHGFQSGTDRGNLWVQWGALTCGVSLLFLVLFRVTSESGARRRGSGRVGVGEGVSAADRIAALRASRDGSQHGHALGDERLDGGVQPPVGERVGQLG
jgi:predicted ferric reductase